MTPRCVQTIFKLTFHMLLCELDTRTLREPPARMAIYISRTSHRTRRAHATPQLNLRYEAQSFCQTFVRSVSEKTYPFAFNFYLRRPALLNLVSVRANGHGVGIVSADVASYTETCHRHVRASQLGMTRRS